MPRDAKHLKAHQFKKGEPSANPEGARRHSPVTKALFNLTVETYREVIQLIMTGNLAALQSMIKDPDTSAVQVGIAMSFMKAIKRGDYHVIERIAERIIGKIPDEINLNSKNTHVSAIDPEMLKAALEKLEKEY